MQFCFCCLPSRGQCHPCSMDLGSGTAWPRTTVSILSSSCGLIILQKCQNDLTSMAADSAYQSIAQPPVQNFSHSRSSSYKNQAPFATTLHLKHRLPHLPLSRPIALQAIWWKRMEAWQIQNLPQKRNLQVSRNRQDSSSLANIPMASHTFSGVSEPPHTPYPLNRGRTMCMYMWETIVHGYYSAVGRNSLLQGPLLPTAIR